MSTEFKFDEELAVGVIQTTVNWELAWPRSGAIPRMSSEVLQFARTVQVLIVWTGCWRSNSIGLT